MRGYVRAVPGLGAEIVLIVNGEAAAHAPVSRT
jgi:hypothetical protein